MPIKMIYSIKPDSYRSSIDDIEYLKLYDNGITKLLFDLDCTLLPFDDTNVPEERIKLVDDLKDMGFELGICSSGFKSRVQPVGEALDINYLYGVPKPFVSFDVIKGLFSGGCKPDNTIMIGDSLFLDMCMASRNNMHKIMVDMNREHKNLKLYANDFLQAIMFEIMKPTGLKKKQYYRGDIER